MGWFARRHLVRQGPGSDVHIADITLWALSRAAAAGRSQRRNLWSRFWTLAASARRPSHLVNPQGHLAFAFSARLCVYSLDALSAMLPTGIEPNDTPARAQRFCCEVLPAELVLP